VFGFLGRLPWKIGGGRGLRYKPSAADLQDRRAAGAVAATAGEASPLLDDVDDAGDDDDFAGAKARKRRSADSCDSVSDSIRSRADLFPSEDEADAVPLDDEFAVGLERRATGQSAETHDVGPGATRADIGGGGGSGGGGGGGPRSASTRTPSSRTAMTAVTAMTSDAEKGGRGRSASAGSLSGSGGVPVATNAGDAISGNGHADNHHDDDGNDDDDSDEFNDVDEGRDDDVGVPTLADLKREEDLVRDEEEAAVQRKRTAAAQLALRRGLSVDDSSSNVRVSRSAGLPSAFFFIFFLSLSCVDSPLSDFCSSQSIRFYSLFFFLCL
jgi:hypothetical protein